MYLRALLAIAWNALFAISGLLLIALAGEIYLRLANPFIDTSIPYQFVDGVGIIRKPNAELRFTNWDDDNWVISHTNSQGFLDREPVSPERAAAGCHIAFIGDSFVEAMQAPIADKFHVRLEQLAARQLPRLDITTQAYGLITTGQINQIPLYDEYARLLNPKLLVLIFYVNDFANNFTTRQSILYGLDPDRFPYTSVQKDEHGALKLRPPNPEYERFLLPMRPNRWYENAWNRLANVSYFAKWVDDKTGIRSSIQENHLAHNRAMWANILAERPCCAALLKTWQPGEDFAYEDMQEYTAFSIDQFKRRADRDGARLAIMAVTGDMGTQGDPQFDLLNSIAKTRGIPVISDYNYILKQGYDEWNGRWRSDGHWNATGHQWVAEAILEWLKDNQDVCD